MWPALMMVVVCVCVCAICAMYVAERHHCCRCGQPFLVYEKGRYQDVDECVYHYGKIRKYRGKSGQHLVFGATPDPLSLCVPVRCRPGYGPAVLMLW